MFAGKSSTKSSSNPFLQHISPMLVEWAKAYWTADFYWVNHSHRVGSWIASVRKQEGLYKVCTDSSQLEYTTFQRPSWFTLLSPISGLTGLDFLPTESARLHEESLWRETAIFRCRHPRWHGLICERIISFQYCEAYLRKGTEKRIQRIHDICWHFCMKKSLFGLLKPGNKDKR